MSLTHYTVIAMYAVISNFTK